MEVGVGVLVPLILILGFVSVLVAAIVYIRSEKEPESLQRRFLHRFYAYAMMFLAALVIFTGGSLLTRAGLAYSLGMPFGYRGEVDGRSGLRFLKESDIHYDESLRTQDLYAGGAFAAIGVLAFLLHRSLRDRVESPEERRQSFLHKGYLMVHGVVFGGVALASIPMAVQQVTSYALISYPAEEFFRRPTPGETLGFAVMALVLWAGIVPALFRGQEE